MAPRRARRPTKPLLLTLTGSAALEVVAAPVEETELDAPLAAPVVAIKVVPVPVVKAAVVLLEKAQSKKIERYQCQQKLTSW